MPAGSPSYAMSSVRSHREARAQHALRARHLRLAGRSALAVVVLAVVVLLALRPPAATGPLAADPVLGSPGAPVVIAYYADFQCPYCREFELGGTMDALLEGYLDTGRAQLVFKDFPIVGSDSWAAAQASEFVWSTAPGQYWAWHRALYEAQGQERSGWASASELVAFTERFGGGLDAAAMRASLAADEHRREVQEDQREGAASGVRGTPTLVIGGQVYNALDVAAWRGALDRALAEAGV